jgi:methyltransferase (TIGR00027 family)
MEAYGMSQKESGLTALIAAFGRAYHSQYDSPKIFDDFLAKDLISPEEFTQISGHMIQGFSFFCKEADLAAALDTPEQKLEWITQVHLSPTPLARAAYCEGVLLQEHVLGVNQYVILGAGLDTFSFRHPELKESLDIFELDLPAAQEFKQQRLSRAGLTAPANLHWVPADFTGASFYAALLAEGFDPSRKTFFNLLGVSYYLAKADKKELLRQLFADAPAGSSIVFDYADETLFDTKGRFNRVENMVHMTTTAGEPMKACYAYAELEKLLEEVGLHIYEHLSPADIQKRFFANRTDDLSGFEVIHYVHAVKR